MNNLYGSYNVTARIVGLNNKKIKENSRKKELQFGAFTRKDNVIFPVVGGWKQDDDAEIIITVTNGEEKNDIKMSYADVKFGLEDNQQIKYDIKVKSENDKDTQSLVPVDSVDYIVENFKNGQTVKLILDTEVDTYFKSLKFNIKQMYISSKNIDFTSEDFKEDSHGYQWIAFKEVNDIELIGVVYNRKDEYIEVKFKLSEFATKNDFKDFKEGDIIQVVFEYNNVPTYEEVVVESKKDDEPKFQAKGKYANKEINNKKTYQQVELIMSVKTKQI